MNGALTSPLAESELLISLLPIGVVLSHERTISRSNSTFADLFGYQLQDLVNKSWEVLFASRSDYREFGDRWIEPLSRHGQHFDERTMLRRDGTPVRVRVRGTCQDRRSPYSTMACTLELVEMASPVAPLQMALSPRERAIVDGLCEGLTSKEIARRLGISHRTVETQRARLMIKVGARNATQLLSILHTSDR